MKEININIDLNIMKTTDEWDCFRKILPTIIPEEKQAAFSKIARKEIIADYDGYHKIPL